MYLDGEPVENIFYLFFEDTKLHPNQIERVFEENFNMPSEMLDHARRFTFERIDDKYRKLQQEQNLSEEDIFKIAYLDLGQHRPWTIRILMKVFNLNISEATGIAWTTLDNWKVKP